MSDPLGEIVSLLRPRVTFAKIASGGGPWRLRRESDGHLFYCVVVAGSCCLQVDGHAPQILGLHDFVLMPVADSFEMSSLHPEAETMDLSEPDRLASGEYWLGARGQPANVRNLVGHCTFASPDAALLVSLMPEVVHVRGERRLATLVALLGEEARVARPGQDVVLTHLLEVMLIEAFRSSAEIGVAPGLLRGLADERMAIAIRRMHQFPGRNWSVEELAREAGLSRSSFFAQFSRTVGLSPMAYLLNWRMALAKDRLRKGGVTVSEVAAHVGYGSASSFSVAFTRHVGMAPARYARHLADGLQG